VLLRNEINRFCVLYSQPQFTLWWLLSSCSGVEDDVHAFGAHNHVSDTAQGGAFVLHVVHSGVSNGYEVHVVVVVALNNQVVLDGLVDVLSSLTLDGDKRGSALIVALTADFVNLTCDLVHLDVRLLAGDNRQVIFRVHHLQDGFKNLNSLGRAVEADSETVLSILFVFPDDRVFDDDQGVRALFGQEVDSSSSDSRVCLGTFTAMHSYHGEGSLLILS